VNNDVDTGYKCQWHSGVLASDTFLYEGYDGDHEGPAQHSEEGYGNDFAESLVLVYTHTGKREKWSCFDYRHAYMAGS
jgi:hypothetical protein